MCASWGGPCCVGQPAHPMQPFWVNLVGTHSPVCLVACVRPPLVPCTVVLLLGSFAMLFSVGKVLGQQELFEP